ncbi:hypothetical protein D3C72_539310 [compost metagenome]
MHVVQKGVLRRLLDAVQQVVAALEGADAGHVGVDDLGGDEVLARRASQSLDLHIAEAGVAEARGPDLLAPAGEGIVIGLQLGVDQTTGDQGRTVLVLLLGQDQGDGSPRRSRHLHLRPTGQDAAEIEHPDARAHLGAGDRLNLLDGADRLGRGGDQDTRRRDRLQRGRPALTGEARRPPADRLAPGVIAFARIDGVVQRRPVGRGPVTVGRHHLAATIGISNLKLGAQRRLGAPGRLVEIPFVRLGHAVPAAPQFGGQHILAGAQQAGHVIGLIEDTLAVVGPAGRHRQLGHGLTVHGQIGPAARCDIEASRSDLAAFDGKGPTQQRRRVGQGDDQILGRHARGQDQTVRPDAAAGQRIFAVSKGGAQRRAFDRNHRQAMDERRVGRRRQQADRPPRLAGVAHLVDHPTVEPRDDAVADGFDAQAMAALTQGVRRHAQVDLLQRRLVDGGPRAARIAADLGVQDRPPLLLADPPDIGLAIGLALGRGAEQEVELTALQGEVDGHRGVGPALGRLGVAPDPGRGPVGRVQQPHLP